MSLVLACRVLLYVGMLKSDVLQCSHVMAMAVQKLFPGAQVTIGPAIERGFYYDFDMPEPITEKDLKAVKKEMQRIIKADLPFVKEEVSHPSRGRACLSQHGHTAIQHSWAQVIVS